jgi:PAS domain S-box-containing protein
MRILPQARRYALAAISCGLALAVAIPFDAPSSCFFLAVIVSSVYGGKGPGIVSVVLSALAFDYFFLPPLYHFSIRPSSYPQFRAFLGAVVLINLLIEAKRRVEESRRQIDAKYRQVSVDALAEARKSEARLRLIIDSIPVPAWSSRADGATDFVNRRWLDYTGIAMEDALGWGWKVAYHPDDLDRNAEYWRSVLASPGERDLEGRLRRFDGTYRWFLFRVCPVRDESGNVAQWYGTCTDIEDRKQAEEALRASAHNLRQVLNSISGYVTAQAPSGAIEFANRPFLEYTGWTVEELKDWPALLHEDDREPVAAQWSTSIETGEPLNTEVRIRRADGIFRWFYAGVRPLRNTEGRIIRWYTLLTDIDDRKKAEEAVRESELQFRTILDCLPGMVATNTATGKMEFINRTNVDYTGLMFEDLRDWANNPVVHPEDSPVVAESWRQALETGNPFGDEFRLRRFDGEYRWMQSRVVPQRDRQGKIVRWYCLATDVDDRRKAEEALRASELNFRLMVDSIPGLLCTNTAAGEVDLVNQTLLDYTGKPLEELRNWPVVVHPGDLPAVASLWTHSVATGHPFNVEVRVRRADGVYRWFHCRGLPLRDTDNRIVRWYNLLTDIEDRIDAEEALRASERDLGLIVETIPALVWCAALDGKVTYVNRRVLEYAGTTLDTLAQDGWTNFLHPDDFEPTVRAWSEAVATGRQYEVQYRLRRSDGAYRWFHVLGQPLRDGEGRLIRWYGLLIDVDDRKSMEEALRSTQTRLSRATQIATVGELAASIAHEVNQPLSAVVSNGHACLRWLSAQPPNLARAHEAAERIVRDGKDAGEVVRRIRALFRRSAVEKVSLDLNEVIGEVLNLLRGETARRRVAVETDLENGLPPAVGDRVQLQQVILNLSLNGLEAMDTVPDRCKKLFIRSKRQNPATILVEVRDGGGGLKDSDKVFEPFFTTKENGMGMGLAICRSIVEAHEGRLWAVPGEETGATFCFTLPVDSNGTA